MFHVMQNYYSLLLQLKETGTDLVSDHAVWLLNISIS